MTRPAPPPAPPIVELYGDILAAGAVLGSYEVDALAFEGGFASIYRGHHRGSGVPAAIKVLRSALAMSVRMIERFEQEARALQRLHHPGIVVIHDLGSLTDGRPYIVMEWIEGRSLAEELAARGPLSPAEALAVMNEVGSAVAAAHAVGVIHRDIKAQNVVTLQQGAWFTVKLIDFGISKLMAPEDQNTAFTTRTMVGTPRTMAPEQILGRSIDARTDIYALGLLSYQLLTGRLPFDGANGVEIEEMHLFAAPPQVSQVAPVPAAVDAVLGRALAKEKADRYPDVPAFLAALAQAIDGTATLPAPAGRVSRAGIGLMVEIPLDAAGQGDAEDRVLAVVDDVMAALDLRAAVETAHVLLAVAPLPESAAEQARLRANLIAGALRIRATAELVLPAAGAGVAVGVRTGALEIVETPAVDPAASAGAGTPRGAGAVVGGALLGDEPWAACRGVAGVVADLGALSGIEERVRTTPLPGQPDLCVVHGLAPDRQMS